MLSGRSAVYLVFDGLQDGHGFARAFIKGKFPSGGGGDKKLTVFRQEILLPFGFARQDMNCQCHAKASMARQAGGFKRDYHPSRTR